MAVAFSQILQLLFDMMFLADKLFVQVLMLSEIILEARDFCVTIVQHVFLNIQLRVQVSILFLSVD